MVALFRGPHYIFLQKVLDSMQKCAARIVTGKCNNESWSMIDILDGSSSKKEERQLTLIVIQMTKMTKL